MTEQPKGPQPKDPFADIKVHEARVAKALRALDEAWARAWSSLPPAAKQARWFEQTQRILDRGKPIIYGGKTAHRNAAPAGYLGDAL